MTVSRLDQLYRRLLLTKFFTRGWGTPDSLKRLFEFRKILSNRESCQHLVAADYPINIDKKYRDGDCVILEGHFTSPFIHHLPGIMPKEVETASFQMILPLQWRHSTLKPVCIHLAGTGDHYFWRRRIITARPLLKEAGIASILLENPYYGTRKPKQQLRSSLHNVSDLFVMGGALVLESLALLHWCEREGWGPLGLSGVSMGGHMASGAATLWPKPISVIPILSWTTASIIFTQMASLAATNWTKPITLAPCLSWSTASCVFTQGVMSGAIPWKTLQEQFFENSVYQDEIRKLIISPEDKRKAYDMGQQFVKDYSHEVEQVECIHQKVKVKQPQGITPPGASKSPRAGSIATSPPVSRGKDNITEQPSPILNSINNCDNTTFPNHVLDSSSGCKDRSVEGVESSLTCEEYIGRVKLPQPVYTDQEMVMLSPSRASEEADLSAVSSGNSSSNVASSVPQQCPSVTQSASSSFQQHSVSSSSNESSASSSVKHPKQLGPLKNEATSQNLNYAKPRQLQQSSIHSLAEMENLTLKDVAAKSRLVMPHVLPPASSNEEHMKDLQLEALDFMRGVMDECTHLGNFSVPVDPELIIIVSAMQDAYVPKDGVIGLDQLWPGCEVRYVDQGHVGAVLFNQSVFRKAIIDGFERQIKKYYQNPGSEHSVESVS